METSRRKMDNWSKFWSMEDFNFLTTINCPIIKNRKEQRKEIQMKNDKYRRKRRKKKKMCCQAFGGVSGLWGSSFTEGVETDKL